MQDATDKPLDLFIIGGGINGVGIARDAAGRGMAVALAEMNDLASSTSSASTKLFHGGLRYLEYLEIRLVREALSEREILLRAMPHISWPKRFVLPYHKDQRFEGDTTVSKMLRIVMPWTRGRRPAWLIRLGLFMYDHMGGRKILPPTSSIDLTTDPVGAPLQDKYRKAYEYSDCCVEDGRLVVLNARDAAERGAEVLTRTRVISAEAQDGQWTVTLEDANGRHTRTARMLVNAAGPWVEDVIRNAVRLNSGDGVRLVRGSHIVTRKLFDHDKCYFFQGHDGRICFAIPYQDDFTMIGTTEVAHPDLAVKPECTPEEADYLRAFASTYFKRPVEREDIVWTFSGVRPLFDDGASSATAATRDYVLRVDDSAGAPVLNVFGGKITTYRRLAEAALARIGARLGGTRGDWTAGAPLPGGDFPVDGVDDVIADLRARHGYLSEPWARRLVRAYGTEAAQVLGNAAEAADLGRDFGATLSEAEVDWLMTREYARSAEDVIWRRSKLGLRMTPEQIAALDAWMRDKLVRG